jgi:hypothetical protein
MRIDSTSADIEDKIPLLLSSPPPGSCPTTAYIAALATIKRLDRKNQAVGDQLEESQKANEELRNELWGQLVVADLVSPLPTSVASLWVPAPFHAAPSSPAPAVSGVKATAPDFRPTLFASPPTMSYLNATAPAFLPATFLPPRPPTRRLPPLLNVVQPIYGPQHDAAAFQYHQQQLQFERERWALAQ